MSRRLAALLVQLPIPPATPQPIVGNVPLAAGYLKLYARRQGLDAAAHIDILPTPLANRLSDQGLVDELVAREPDLLGFSCYLWNIDRTLWVAERVKARRPHTRIVLGGPEITADNAWVLDSPAVDFAVIGEGEQTWCELLAELTSPPAAGTARAIDGLWRRGDAQPPARRAPLPHLNDISSPYLHGILDAAEERLLLLETIRGCIFKCKFCYYPKAYDDLYFLTPELIEANLRHAAERGAREVVLLDPTLNQRRQFDDFVRLLARHNRNRQFTYFGELRAEGITPTTAALLREANFTEVEIGLQSIDPLAQTLMDRKNNQRAFERGVAALLNEGLRVKIDLIIGLPGDTAASIGRGYEYLAASGLYSEVQVFNLAVLPGTAFRHEAATLGLRFQPRPPYYVLETPTLATAQLYELMQQAEETFDTEYDPLPPPRCELPPASDGLVEQATIDLDRAADGGEPDRPLAAQLPPAARRTQAFSLRLRSRDLHARREAAAGVIERLLDDNPHSTLEVLVEPLGERRRVTPAALERLLAACYRTPSYLDRYASFSPRGMSGAKRIAVLAGDRSEPADDAWLDAIGSAATLVWRDDPAAAAHFAG